MDLQHIAILKEFLHNRIDPIRNDILQTIHKGIIKRLGVLLHVENIRIYLFSISGRNIQEKQVVGDSKEWKIVEIDKVTKDVVVYQNLHFVKIKYSNDDGRLITIGFLGIYREKKLSKSEIGLLEVLCILYGDYVRKRISLTINSKIRTQLKNIIATTAKGGLPGTIVTKCLTSFHRSFNSYASYYFVVDGNNSYIEYLKLENSGNAFFPRKKKIFISDDLLKAFDKKHIVINGNDARINSIYKHLQTYDDKVSSNFILFIFPARSEGVIIGFWLLIFSDTQFFDVNEVVNLIDFTDAIIKDNYKYLFQRSTKKMIVDPIFKNRETRVDRRKIFTLMPFTLDWSSRIWLQMIKPVVENAGFEAIRADDLFGADIMEDIWTSILSSHLVIADITGRNPNVFYELGIAHTLGKNVILITQNKDDIPFDLNRYRHIIYEDNYDGYELLKHKLAGAIADLSK